MNILFVVKGIGLEGAGKQLVLLANALSENGYNVFIHSLFAVKARLKIKSGITFIPPQSGTRMRQLQWFKYPFIIRKIAKKHHIDLIISWRTNAGSYATLATMGTKIKTIFCERSDPYMEPSNIHAITTFLASLSDGGVFQTPKVRDYYQRLAPKSVVIPNFIDLGVQLPKFANYSSRPREIVYVGRLSILQKRQDILLKSMSFIHHKMPEYVLRIYGDGKDREALIRMSREMGLEKFVFFEGSVSNVMERIRTARLLLLTSDFEGIPNVILEAFQVGIPVVTTDCSPGGCHMLIEDGVNGFITPFRDAEKVAEKSVELLSDENLAKKFIFNSFEKLKCFDLERIVLLWTQYIEKVYSN